MSLYAVKNDKGEWWDFEAYDGFWSDGSCECAVTAYQERADSVIKEHGGHVVELTDAPANVVVSENEAEMLKRASKDVIFPASSIADYVAGSYIEPRGVEDRLMRAYVNGWTVEKPKRWNVKVPLVQAQGGLWFFVNSDGKVDATYDQDLAQKFTAAEIEHYGLGDCEKVEVRDE